MPAIGEKSSEHPFGYGYCACGCGKVTKVVGGVPLKYFQRLHNPRAVEIDRQLALRRAEPPPVKRLAPGAVAKGRVNERLAQAVAWTKANPDFIEWHRKKLRARSAETAKRYQRERRTRDPVFKLAANMRNRIGAVLKKGSATKSGGIEELVGCSIQQLRDHLQAQFTAGMTWENCGQWHVDHIRPCASFDLSKPEEQRACFHYTNLQPLWGEENLRKTSHYGGRRIYRKTLSTSAGTGADLPA
jgi:hypothetical protein